MVLNKKKKKWNGHDIPGVAVAVVLRADSEAVGANVQPRSSRNKQDKRLEWWHCNNRGEKANKIQIKSFKNTINMEQNQKNKIYFLMVILTWFLELEQKYGKLDEIITDNQ